MSDGVNFAKDYQKESYNFKKSLKKIYMIRAYYPHSKSTHTFKNVEF